MNQENQTNPGTSHDKKRRRSLIMGIILFLIAIVLMLIPKNKITESEPYQPIEEFQDAYEALQPSTSEEEEKTEEAYDLEKTIRVINGLEIAQHRMGSFDDFLGYMARQDYSGVPDEVLEAKAKMMPVMQKLFLLQKEHEELNLWTSLAQQLGNDVVDGIGAGEIGALAVDEGIGGLLIIRKTAKYVFEQYQNEQKLKGELKKQIQEVEDEYLDYLASFTPIFIKYMNEWDRLCIDKDKAYIDLYNNKPELVIEDCDRVLANYPDNRETLLLKSMGLIQVSRHFSDDDTLLRITTDGDSLSISLKESYLTEAQSILDNYIYLYPDQAAPALLLEGMVQEYQGNHDKALMLYDQSSVEYPRQAERLTDMLDSYRTRTYLNNSLEGNYLLNLYKSTMSGFGFFSPNLIKALYYDQNGDYANCSKEIYNHFFRRSNQGTYDCLLLDMKFCEEQMPNSFNRLLPEKNYINLNFEKRSKMLGLSSDKMSIDVTIENMADIDLVNLRVFLCIHFTDMYYDDYYVIKLPTINRVPVLSSTEVENIALDYQGKSFDDISKVRAIAMTDDKICWIDNVFNVSDNIDYNAAHSINYQSISTTLDSVSMLSRDSYFAAIEKNAESFRKSILNNTRIEFVEEKSVLRKTKTFISVELPRELILLSPNFSWDRTLMPTENYLKGSYIHLSFDTPLPESGTLYMISDYLNFAIDIQKRGDKPFVKAVREL